MRKQKIIKRIIFALFFLQIIKFEEIRNNCLYIIVYNDLYIIIYEQFFLTSLNLIICKRNNAKIIFLIIFFSYIKYPYMIVDCRQQSEAKKMYWFPYKQKDGWLSRRFSLLKAIAHRKT